ncbi:MAG: type II toxin-antitoxin system RelE/ParE family toxin [Deltaproteobacteria bacterium]|jgi:mRNA-degrading endonuclease RelE of RelBE toxin-antitoxin system|nr:MAG: type II toxin-antitoxin system RelE/ParE family toxin [Deltaproteobacteria bacterium]
MYEIEFHHYADEEMKAAAVYYEERVTGLGGDFLDEVKHGLDRIRQFPLLWPIYEGEYRRYLLKRFPYGLIYRIETEKIFIIAVAHLHRKPRYWKGRG